VGSRSGARARAQASVAVGAAAHPHPVTLTLAAAVQAIQSAAILAASVLAGIAASQGKAYQNSSGVAITAIGIGTALALGFVAWGLARARRWSRTPALLTQLFTGIVGIYLVQGARYAWGGPALVLSVAGFALLLVPSSLRALAFGEPDPPA